MSKSAPRVCLSVTELTGNETFTELQELRQFVSNPPSEYLAERDKGSIVRAIANAKVLVGRHDLSGEVLAALVTYDHDGDMVELGTLRVKDELEGYGLGPTFIALAVAKEVFLEEPKKIVALCKDDHPKIPACLRDLGFDEFMPSPAVLRQLNHDVAYTSSRLFFDLAYHKLANVADRLKALGDPPWTLTHRSGGEALKVNLDLRLQARGMSIAELVAGVREKTRPAPALGIAEDLLRLFKRKTH